VQPDESSADVGRCRCCVVNLGCSISVGCFHRHIHYPGARASTILTFGRDSTPRYRYGYGEEGLSCRQGRHSAALCAACAGRSEGRTEMSKCATCSPLLSWNGAFSPGNKLCQSSPRPADTCSLLALLRLDPDSRPKAAASRSQNPDSTYTRTQTQT
jgi:hypothetical protein